jgi:hypothetical protein
VRWTLPKLLTESGATHLSAWDAAALPFAKIANLASYDAVKCSCPGFGFQSI